MSRLFAIARNTWRTLTSMGTALVLLFLLALAAIPGALLPQRSLNEGKVEQSAGWSGCCRVHGESLHREGEEEHIKTESE